MRLDVDILAVARDAMNIRGASDRESILMLLILEVLLDIRRPLHLPRVEEA